MSRVESLCPFGFLYKVTRTSARDQSGVGQVSCGLSLGTKLGVWLVRGFRVLSPKPCRSPVYCNMVLDDP